MAIAHPRLRFQASTELQRGLRFACVGLIGVGVNSVLLWLLTERAHLYYLVSSALATEVAILHNFALNHFWTFAALRDQEPLLVKLAKFNAVSLGGLLLTVGALYTLTQVLGLHYVLANVAAVGAGAAWNFGANRLWTWTAGAGVRTPPAAVRVGMPSIAWWGRPRA